MKNKQPIDYSQILQKESRAQYVQHKILLGLSVEEAVETGEALGPVRFVNGPHSKSLWLETKGYYSRFRRGDTTELRCAIDKTSIVTAVDNLTVKGVDFPSPGVIRIEITKKKDFLPIPGEFFLYPQINDYFDRLVQTKLQAIGGTISRLTAIQRPQISLEVLKPFEANLNASQIEAVRFIVQAGLRGAIQGPPGTGKTQVLRAIAQIAISQKLRVGIAAFTHAAVDNALGRVAEVLPQNSFIRIGDKNKIRTDLYKDSLRPQDMAPNFSKMPAGNYSVIAATTHSWALSDKAPEVDVMIIDEAAQVPGYMDTLLGVRARSFILLGDHRQLPPVLKADHGDATLDLFSRYLEPGTPMLETQYRMNDEIQEWSSKTLYSGKLKAHSSNKDRDIVRNMATQTPDLGTQAVQLRLHNGSCHAKANAQEAGLVSELVQKFLTSNQIPPNQIGIISPHRTHAGAICQALQEKIGHQAAGNVTVDTVERFQGQEKEVVVLSFGAEEEGSIQNRESVFLGEPRRLNVAVTRAKSRFYCYAPEKLVQYSKEKARSDSALPSFLSWCGTKKAA